MALLGELIRFWTVGLVCICVQFGILVSLVEWAHLNPTLSSAIGSVHAFILNYFLLYHWAFRSTSAHRGAGFRFLIFTLFTLGINLLIFWTLTEKFGMWYPSSQFTATFISSLFSFAVNRRYTF